MLTLGVTQDDPNLLRKSALYTLARNVTFKKVKMTGPRATGHSWVQVKSFDDDDTEVLNSSWGFGPNGMMHPDIYHNRTGDNVIYKTTPSTAAPPGACCGRPTR